MSERELKKVVEEKKKGKELIETLIKEHRTRVKMKELLEAVEYS